MKFTVSLVAKAKVSKPVLGRAKECTQNNLTKTPNKQAAFKEKAKVLPGSPQVTLKRSFYKESCPRVKFDSHAEE